MKLGRFNKFGLNWEQLEQLIQIVVTPPDITIVDELKNAQTKAIERQNNVLSSKRGLRKAAETIKRKRRICAQERAIGLGPQPAPTSSLLPLGNPATNENQNTTKKASGETGDNPDMDGVDTKESRFERARAILFEGYP